MNMELVMATFNISFQTTINAHPENRTEDTVPDSSVVAEESLAPYQVAVTLWQVCPPVILLLGTFGNCMTLVILRTMPRGGSSGSMSLFFAALAVSDLALLYTGLLHEWLYRTVTLDLRKLHDVICKVHVFLVYLSTMTSAWFLVAMTMQRVVSVLLPHRVGLLSTRRKVQTTVLVVVVLLVAINAHHLAAIRLQEPSTNDTSEFCANVVDHDDALSFYALFVFPWIDLVVSSFLPSSLLLVGNVLLATTVTRSARLARRLTAAPTGSDRRSDVREKAASSLTVTLMSVSVTYICLSLPVSIFIIVQHYLSRAGARYNAWMHLAWAVVNLMWYCNSTVNFYMYCLTGTRFRAQCKRLLCGACAAPVTSGSIVSMTTSGSRSTVCEKSESEKDNDDDF